MTEAIYTVNGMSCGHCVSSVTEEVRKLDGVIKVEVDLPASRVVVTSDAPLSTEQISSAVTEAGYQLVTS
ncbi:heavy-metal-associated domain-containing protein [Amycolatopsis anabasis]|uniref:heavy-metal-associated domain-containing protein n=1 Tax=Amycolatopsis anabasis TaxID=1840409 RepID=UPI00131D4F8E|nr:heavy-metal-associated domain-containing protein [Amycolatopsis anabasis]